MSEWQPIQTAPKNKVVLTDEGTGKWDGRWYLCTTDGVIPSCADWGLEPSEIEPVRWMPLPNHSNTTRAETAEAERDAMRAERDEAIKHVRTWVSWCGGPAQPHPYDNVQAAKAFLATLKGEK